MRQSRAPTVSATSEAVGPGGEDGQSRFHEKLRLMFWCTGFAVAEPSSSIVEHEVRSFLRKGRYRSVSALFFLLYAMEAFPTIQLSILEAGGSIAMELFGMRQWALLVLRATFLVKG